MISKGKEINDFRLEYLNKLKVSNFSDFADMFEEGEDLREVISGKFEQELNEKLKN